MPGQGRDDADAGIAGGDRLGRRMPRPGGPSSARSHKGKLADLVVVAGDPLADIAVLRDPDRIALVLKDGEIAANRMPQIHGR